MKNLRILVVDDDLDFAEAIADALELEGHEIQLAHSGEAALEAYTESEFDLTFMDIKLPGWNGVESFREFQRRFPGARVVMMTAYTLDNLIDAEREWGVVGVFHKPLPFDQVRDVLNRVRQNVRVLVVDDDVDFAREMRDMLEVAGYSVRSCFDGVTAIQRCLEESFDAMILDLRLPGASGAEVYETVHAARPALRVIAVTGHADLEGATPEGSETIEFEHLLRKPFSPGRLLGMLERV